MDEARRLEIAMQVALDLAKLKGKDATAEDVTSAASKFMEWFKEQQA